MANINMFATADKINRAIDQVIKATEEIEREDRKQQALQAVHVLSVLRSDCLSDLTAKK